MKHTDESQTLTRYKHVVEIEATELCTFLRERFKMPDAIVDFLIDQDNGDVYRVVLTEVKETRS